MEIVVIGPVAESSAITQLKATRSPKPATTRCPCPKWTAYRSARWIARRH